jgi:FdhE protein
VNEAKWERRTKRARELAGKYPFAAEVLEFYSRVCGLQKALDAKADEWRGKAPQVTVFDASHFALSVRPLVASFRQFLGEVQAFAPPPIAQAASELKASVNGKCEELLADACRDVPAARAEEAEAERVVASLFLQPYLENLAGHAGRLAPNTMAHVCPFCSGRPVAGALRAEGDGAKRLLICSRCLTEWAYGRILCAACGEAAVEKLAVYTASQFEHVRIESCDTCGRYLKTVDLTRDGHALPVVDELATVPLDLWAVEHGYSKIQANILGI